MGSSLDSRAKSALRKWPQRAKSYWSPPRRNTYWLRAQPVVNRSVGPRLSSPGSTLFKTQPDGMWLLLEPNSGYADVFAVEACGSISNLRDKRSRYTMFGSSLLVTCPLHWLSASIVVQHGGTRPRWSASGTFSHCPEAPLILPIRAVRVLFALTQSARDKWRENGMAASHEFYCTIGQLEQQTSQTMQRLLKRASPYIHFA